MQWPKQCSCGLAYGAVEWSALALRGHMAMELGTSPALELRNCSCGSTLGVNALSARLGLLRERVRVAHRASRDLRDEATAIVGRTVGLLEARSQLAYVSARLAETSDSPVYGVLNVTMTGR